MSQVVRVTRELFLSDRELKFALGIPDQAVILAVKRETGSTRRQGAKVDLWGCLVTVYDPNPDLSRP